MIALYIIGAIILLLGILLLLPIGVRIKYDGSAEVYFVIASLSFRIKSSDKSDKKADDKKKAKKKEKVKKKKKTDKTKKKLSLDDIIQIIKASLKALERLKNAVDIKRCNVNIVASGDDAASAAINYGKICAASTLAYSFLENKLNKEDTDISVDLEYDSTTKISFDVIVKAMILKLLIIALKLIFVIIPILNNDKRKGGKQNV